MPKKNLIYIIGTAIILTAIFIINNNNESDLIDEFEIKDVSLVTKIFLADRNGNTITLDKKDDQNWIVNNSFEVRKDAISTILSTINQIRIKKPVSNKAYQNVIKYMATTGVSIEIFSKEKMIKSYVIGSNTSDHLGTHMLLKNSPNPYVTHIPAFNGFLSPRYGIQANIIDINSWRSNTVFNIQMESINKIQYTNKKDSTQSYTISRNPLIVKDFEGKEIKHNNQKVLKLLNSFQNLNCEKFKADKFKIKYIDILDELIINTDTLRTYSISENKIKSKEENFTVKRKYATKNSGELMLIQDYVFNKVLININEITY